MSYAYVLGCIILCGQDCIVHCRMFSSIWDLFILKDYSLFIWHLDSSRCLVFLFAQFSNLNREWTHMESWLQCWVVQKQIWGQAGSALEKNGRGSQALIEVFVIGNPYYDWGNDEIWIVQSEDPGEWKLRKMPVHMCVGMCVNELQKLTWNNGFNSAVASQIFSITWESKDI